MTTSTLMTEAPSTSAADASQAAPAQDATQATPGADTQAQTAAASTDAAQTQESAGDQSDGEQKTASDEADKPAGAPEKYEFKAPEGVALDADLLGEFEGVARELDLPQDKAQQVVDKLAPKMAERMAAQQAQIVAQAREEWAATARADKEFGGDKLPENMAIVGKAMAAFGTPELRTLLDESGLGNHPEVIRAFFRAGKAISEDSVVTGAGDATPAAPTAKSLYPNSPDLK